MNSIYINLFSINLGSQPNGGLAENCVTTFKESKDDYSPSWYDRPCVEENDSFGDVGHKFMCECDVPYQNQNAQVCNYLDLCLCLLLSVFFHSVNSIGRTYLDTIQMIIVLARVQLF